MSVEEDELRQRVSILEAKVKKLEERNGLLAVILTLTFVAAFISLAAMFLNFLNSRLVPVPMDAGVALVVTSALLIFLFILGRRTLESSARKSAKST